MPITVASKILYHGDFEDGVNPWKTSLPEDQFAALTLESDGGGNDFVTTTGPWWIDPNHKDPGAGYLNLLFFSYLADLNGGPADFHFSGTNLTVDIRPTDLVVPDGAHVYFWFQTYDFSLDRYVNYVMSSTPIEDQLVDGEWRTVSITLSAEDADWTALGSNADRTSVYGVSVSVAHALSTQILDWGIFLFLGNGVPPAETTGSIAFDNVTITLDPDGVRSFMERDVNAGPQRFDIAVNIDEPVSGFNGVVLEASIAGIAGDELLTVSSGVGGLSVTNGEISFNGLLIAETSGGSGSPLVVTFNADATADAVEAVIYALGYSTSSDDPATSRSVDVTLTDTDTTVTSVASFELRLVPEAESDGNDVYAFTDSSDHITPIFDEGGTDTIDASLVTLNSSISLKAGYYPPGQLEIYTVGSTRIETVLGGSGRDVIRGSAFADTIEANGGNDTIYGEEGNDALHGGTGDDAFQGGAGADLLDGGDGFDIVYFSDATSGVVADLLNVDASSEDTFVLIEAISGSGYDDRLLGDAQGNLLLGLAGNDVLMGRDGNDLLYGAGGTDTLTGGADADLLDGGTGADTMSGGLGDDQYYVDAIGDVVQESAGQGNDRVLASLSYTLAPGLSIETLSTTDTLATTAITLTGNEIANNIYGNYGNNSLYGGGGNDVLIAHNGDDTLIGGTGADSMTGGLGNDMFYIDNSGDVVNESAGEGSDRVLTSISYTLATAVSVETLSTDNAVGTAAINLTGNELANNIYGNYGNNSLYGGGGNDVLIAHDGDDTLIGGTGADSMTGGLGNDWFYVDNAGDTVNEATGQGSDRVLTAVTYTLAAGAWVETLSTDNATGTSAITLTGNDIANNIYGNYGNNSLYGGGGNDVLIAHDGDDTLIGGTGADSMTGGLGNDWFYVDNAGDTVNEAAGEGTDRVLASISYTLAAGLSVETLATDNATGTAAINLTGNEIANNVYGNYGNNVLNGGGGNDVLIAHDGNDTLNGGTGADSLSGGAGADTFVFSSAAGVGNIDTIADYNVADDLFQIDNAVFTGLADGALAAGAFNTGAAATEADDRIIYNSATGALLFDADGNGAGAAVQFATLGTGLAMSSSEFFVI